MLKGDIQLSIVLYFSKLNLVSGHIFQVYKEDGLLTKILDILRNDLSSSIVYKREEVEIDSLGQSCLNNIAYKLNIMEKGDSYIKGHLCKDSTVYYKSFDSTKGELVRHSVPNTEAVNFYFDIFNEMIGFHTANRLGFREFNDAFTGIINKCMEENSREYRFDLSLINEGLNIEEITEQLREIGNIKELKFKFQPPNADTEEIKRIKENGEELIDIMESGNITNMSVLFTSKGTEGVNIDAEIIKENIERIRGINSVIGDRRAINKGYTGVEAQGKDGKKYTTADSKPIKVSIDNIAVFYEECKKLIRSLI